MIQRKFSIRALRGLSLPAAPNAALRPPLRLLSRFGSNPGALKGFASVPTALPTGAPLVVVLHGCTQDANSYARGSGWSTLGERHGFAVLFVEQQRANNANLCFNWFEAEDQARDGGEPESIGQMVTAMVRDHQLDPDRVFVTGLSAGGAMASIMLATHPDVFAGGAIIAGLPFGAATGLNHALKAMRSPGRARDLPLPRDASSAGRLPSVSVWHGTADHVVHPGNGTAIIDQWSRVHGDIAAEQSEGEGFRSTVWRDGGGRKVLEHHRIAGMGHGLPIATSGDERSGELGPHILDIGLASTYRIAASWGIVPDVAPPFPTEQVVSESSDSATIPYRPAATPASPEDVIRKALTSAGLL